MFKFFYNKNYFEKKFSDDHNLFKQIGLVYPEFLDFENTKNLIKNKFFRMFRF